MKYYIRHIKFKICKFLGKILSYVAALWKTFLSTLRSLLSTLLHLLTSLGHLTTRYSPILLLLATIGLALCIPRYLNNLNNSELEEEYSLPIDSVSYIYEADLHISDATLFKITDNVLTLFYAQENYTVPVGEPFVSGYVHYYIIGTDIQNRVKSNPEEVLTEVSNLRRLIQRIWVNQDIAVSSITLSILSDTQEDTVVVSSDNESTYLNTETQLKYIPGDSESEQVYLDFLENKSNY